MHVRPTPRSPARRALLALLGTIVLAAPLALVAPASPASAAGPCGPPVLNPVACENTKPGSPASEWDITGAGDPSIQGFATDISVNRGDTVHFKVKTDASAYRFDVYRLGFYGGLGARKFATTAPTAALPQTQPACLNDSTTGLIDCGSWSESGSWAVPADAVSGIYVAHVVRPDTGGSSHIVFVVRDDASTSGLVFQTSDTAWQAYNDYGGNSLYKGTPVGRAYKV
ncbi:MAG TPA: N,N-dimethylformamidase beta subunit family domain-containing protein, partial [Acidimicrobiales bacterium]